MREADALSDRLDLLFVRGVEVRVSEDNRDGSVALVVERLEIGLGPGSFCLSATGTGAGTH